MRAQPYPHAALEAPVQFYLLVDGKMEGPFDGPVLMQMLAGSEIPPETPCARLGDEGWTTAGRIFPHSLPGSYPTRAMKERPGVERDSPGFKAGIVILAVVFLVAFLAVLLAQTGQDGLGVLVGIVFGVPIYFAPTLLAGTEHRNFAAIFALNLLLGWTLIGWVAALVWALYREKG